MVVFFFKIEMPIKQNKKRYDIGSMCMCHVSAIGHAAPKLSSLAAGKYQHHYGFKN